MTRDKLISAFKSNGLFYLAGAAIILCFKLYCRAADSEALSWVLAPTAGWVEWLSGITFEKEAHIGFVNHLHRVIIAPSCSGVRFMTVVFATLLYPFVHRMKTFRARLGWTLLCVASAYVYTVFANGIRIVLSIFVRAPVSGAWLPADFFHTLEGMTVYFTALCLIYQIAGRACRRWGGESRPQSATFGQMLLSRCAPPALLYFAFTLGVPLLRGAYAEDPGYFAAYSLLMLAVFAAAALVFCLAFMLKRHQKS